MINWDDPNLGKGEQERILVPLSKARAAAIAKALAARGIDAKRMSIEGVGASKQVVPDSDTVNRWKNRRVEFYLEK
jgi:outer membrane protein OmpA-like peptidoglycan-associated protein